MFGNFLLSGVAVAYYKRRHRMTKTIPPLTFRATPGALRVLAREKRRRPTVPRSRVINEAIEALPRARKGAK